MPIGSEKKCMSTFILVPWESIYLCFMTEFNSVHLKQYFPMQTIWSLPSWVFLNYITVLGYSLDAVWYSAYDKIAWNSNTYAQFCLFR